MWRGRENERGKVNVEIVNSERSTYGVIGEKPCVLVEDEPAVLPAVDHVGPLAERPLHETARDLLGRHGEVT